VSTFPFVFSNQNSAWHFGIFGNEVEADLPPKLTAFCAGRILRWRTPQFGEVRALCVGSVCTDPTEESKGFASQSIEKALAAVEKNGLDLCLLFSEARTLYKRLGFKPCGPDLFVKGRNLYWTISEFDDLRPAKFQFANSQSLAAAHADDAEVQRIVKALWESEMAFSPSGMSVLDFEEFLICLTIPRQIVFWLEDKNGRIVSLARYEKGCDFRKTLFGLFSEDFKWSMQLVREVMSVRDIDCLMVESFQENWGSVCQLVEGQEVQMLISASRPEMFNLFDQRVCLVRGIQSC
jgi:hypothetical protein